MGTCYMATILPGISARATMGRLGASLGKFAYGRMPFSPDSGEAATRVSQGIPTGKKKPPEG